MAPQIILRAYSDIHVPASLRIPVEHYFNDLLPRLGIQTAIEFVDGGWFLFIESFRDFRILYTPSQFRQEVTEEIDQNGKQAAKMSDISNPPLHARNDPYAWEMTFKKIPPDRTEGELVDLVEFYYNAPGGVEGATFEFAREERGKKYYRVTRASLDRYIQTINLSIMRIQRALESGSAREILAKSAARYEESQP